MPAPAPRRAPSARPPAPRSPAPAAAGRPHPAPAPEADQPVRVPAQFTVRGSRLSPPSVSVPPFLAVELSIASGDGRPHRGTLATHPPRALAVPARGRLVVKLRGLKRGSYALRLSGGAHATLVIGAEPGP